MPRYAWLFDRRFDPLRPAFEAHLAGTGRAPGTAINAYDEFPDVRFPDDGRFPELRQLLPEEVNQSFSRRWLAGERWAHDGDAPMPVVSFTNDGLLDVPDIDRFGVSGKLVRELSAKTSQYPLFQNAGLPLPPFAVGDAQTLLHRGTSLLDGGALFIQPAFSAGGEQATLIRSTAELAAYARGLADRERVVAARFVPDCRPVSGNGVVTRGGQVLSLGVVELLQEVFRYNGFILPVFDEGGLESEMHDLTIQVGELLRSWRYWGFFTADAIRPPDGPLLLTEANVRFSGEATFIAARCGCNLFDLIDGRVAMPDRVVGGRHDRIVVTKIRPDAAQIAWPRTHSSVEEFLARATDSFRVAYLREPTLVISGHFVGLAGLRLNRHQERDQAIAFYDKARRVETTP